MPVKDVKRRGQMKAIYILSICNTLPIKELVTDHLFIFLPFHTNESIIDEIKYEDRWTKQGNNSNVNISYCMFDRMKGFLF
jgi:hypothetical protein